MTFGKRLEAARKSRGFISSYQAAVALGYDHQQYAMWEASTDVPAKVSLQTLADRFGITSAFLRHGRASTLADRWAEAMLGSLELEPRQWILTERRLIAERLTTVRLARGFRMISSAASFFGWSVDIYADHEAGRRPFTESEIATYAYAYDVPLMWFYDSSRGFTYADDLWKGRTSRDVRRFLNEHLTASPPEAVWVPTYSSLATLVDAMMAEDRTGNVPDGYSALSIEALSRYTTCQAKNLLVLRYSWTAGKSQFEFVLKTRRKSRPEDREIAIYQNGSQLSIQIVKGDCSNGSADVKLRLPIIMATVKPPQLNPRPFEFKEVET